jgi:hypothetical protein
VPLIPEDMEDYIVPENLSDNEKSFPASKEFDKDSEEKDNV